MKTLLTRTTQKKLPKHVHVAEFSLTTAALYFSYLLFLFSLLLLFFSLSGATSLKKQSVISDILSKILQKFLKTLNSKSANPLRIKQLHFFLVKCKNYRYKSDEIKRIYYIHNFFFILKIKRSKLVKRSCDNMPHLQLNLWKILKDIIF